MNTAPQWSMLDVPIQLRHGCHMFRMGETWMIAIPDERFIRLRVPPEQIEALLPVLHGQQTPQQKLAAEAATPLRALLDQFGNNQLLEPVVEHHRVCHTGRVLVQGNNPLAAEVVRLLTASGVAAWSHEAMTIPDAPPAALVTCADWLPDAAWQTLDAWCQRVGVAWHMAYAEGTRFYLGPLAIPNTTPSYADVRARRLAAAPFPDELLAYWEYVETSAWVPLVRWPNAGGIAMLAGALVADVLACLAGTAIPSAGDQYAFDPADNTWKRHPVLPIPRDLMEMP